MNRIARNDWMGKAVTGIFVLLIIAGVIQTVRIHTIRQNLKEKIEYITQLHIRIDSIRETSAELIREYEGQLYIFEEQFDSLTQKHNELIKTYERAKDRYSSINYVPDRRSDYYKKSWSKIIRKRPGSEFE